MTESEWRTRKDRIDRRLRHAGWSPLAIEQPTTVREGTPFDGYGTAGVEEYPTETGPADYLLVDGGRPLAVVEAKKLSLGPQNALV